MARVIGPAEPTGRVLGPVGGQSLADLTEQYDQFNRQFDLLDVTRGVATDEERHGMVTLRPGDTFQDLLNQLHPDEQKELLEDIARAKKEQDKYIRSVWDDAFDRLVAGTANVLSGLSGGGSLGATSMVGPQTPLAGGVAIPYGLIPGVTEASNEVIDHFQNVMRGNRDLFWEIAQSPELAAQNTGLVSKVMNMTAETIPYITATSASYLLGGPIGGFATGSMVEGNSSYMTALDYFREANNGKPLTDEQRSLARKIGAGVGIVSGAIEAFGGAAAESAIRKKINTKIADSLAKKLAKSTARYNVGVLTEALEESGQEIAAIIGESNYRSIDWRDAISRVATSAVAGGTLGGVFKSASVSARMATKLPALDISAVVGPNSILTKQVRLNRRQLQELMTKKYEENAAKLEESLNQTIVRGKLPVEIDPMSLGLEELDIGNAHVISVGDSMVTIRPETPVEPAMREDKIAKGKKIAQQEGATDARLDADKTIERVLGEVKEADVGDTGKSRASVVPEPERSGRSPNSYSMVLGVDPDFQRRGVGTDLVTRAMYYIDERGGVWEEHTDFISNDAKHLLKSMKERGLIDYDESVMNEGGLLKISRTDDMSRSISELNELLPSPDQMDGEELSRLSAAARLGVEPFISEDAPPLDPSQPIGDQLPPAKPPKDTGLGDDSREGKRYNRTLSRVGRWWRATKLGSAKAFTPMVSRLRKINPAIARQVRRYEYNMLHRSIKDIDQTRPFLSFLSSLNSRKTRADYDKLSEALLNSDHEVIGELIEKYDQQENYLKAREVLDDIHKAAELVGIDMTYLEDYWHRSIADSEGMLNWLQKSQDWSMIDDALDEYAGKLGINRSEIDADESAQIINTLLRSYAQEGVTLAIPGPAMNRRVPKVTGDLKQFYDSPERSIIKYIRLMHNKIAQREFFGKESKEISKVRSNVKKIRKDLAEARAKMEAAESAGNRGFTWQPVAKLEEALRGEEERLFRMSNTKVEDSIGAVIGDLRRKGELDITKEHELSDILTGIFNPKRMGHGVRPLATMMYFDTLNSPLQALTQLDEFAYSFYRSKIRSVPALIRAAANKSEVSIHDLGIRSIGEEFQGRSMEGALGNLLKITGFEKIDRMNKQAYVNTRLSQMRSWAKGKRPSRQLVDRARRAFGGDYQSVINDLKKGEITDDVKYLLFNELLDIQPLAISEMPEWYSRSGSLRILYALKSFYLKRVDFARDEALSLMKSPRTFAQGLARLTSLGFSFALMGAGSDAIKDLIKGEEFDLSDSVVENMLSMVLLSKYTTQQVTKEGAQGVMERALPPTKVVDATVKHVVGSMKGKHRWFEMWRSPLVRSVPLFGETYYWWFGEGQRKREERRLKEAGKLPGAQPFSGDHQLPGTVEGL